MQHPSSDRLITTHNATYIEPRFMPGYRGHCPLEKFDYGQTYGNFTAKQFQDYRSTALNSSMTPYRNGGIFPTYYSYTPDIVINNQKASRERYTDRFDVNLYNTDHARQKEIQTFDLLAQQHREYYKDKTGTLYPVPTFQLPKASLQRIKERYMI
ncbi:hypothetical protein AHF37_10557 [Paragonimus kellicotti]|nr:hypothetical protein AHF37_10557 [Paragonimus kellicotti]